MANWRDLASTLDAAIDNQYGEAIKILPYKTSRALSAPIPDSARTILIGVGYVVGRFSGLRGAAGDFVTKRAEADLLLSIQDKYMGDVKKGDRIELTERSMTCEVSYIEPGSTNGRSVIHLLRIPGNA